MATVTGLTAARMLAIEAMSVISGIINGDDLILTKHDGTTINAGRVRGHSMYGITGAFANISSMPGSAIGDYFINGDPVNRTILGVTAAPGDVIKATSATAGVLTGNLRGIQGPQGSQGNIGNTGAKGAGFYSVTADLANISGVSGSAVGDYFVNGDTVNHTILGVTAVPGDVIKSTSATAGTLSGSIRGAAGPQGTPGTVGTGPAGGDLGSNYPNPTVEKITKQFLPFGLGGLLASHINSYASLTANYNSPTDRLIDTAKPGWQIRLDAPNDRFGIYRAPPTAGAPAFVLIGSVDFQGLANFVGGLQSNGVTVVKTDDSRLSDKRNPKSPEVLDTVRGRVDMATGGATILSPAGGGFTVNRTAVGVCVVTFATAFATLPAFVPVVETSFGRSITVSVTSTTSVTVRIWNAQTPEDRAFGFIAMG